VQLTSSVLESLTRLPALEREAILASLSESEAAQLHMIGHSLRGQISFPRLGTLALDLI
jgi:hypothetical protein